MKVKIHYLMYRGAISRTKAISDIMKVLRLQAKEAKTFYDMFNSTQIIDNPNCWIELEEAKQLEALDWLVVYKTQAEIDEHEERLKQYQEREARIQIARKWYNEQSQDVKDNVDLLINSNGPSCNC